MSFKGLQLLHEFHWLKQNGYLVSEHKKKRTTEPEGPEVSEWYERAAKFDEMNSTIARLLTRLTFCKNRSLLYDLYPYVWDVKGAVSLLNSYVKWLGENNSYFISKLESELTFKKFIIIIIIQISIV